MPSIGEGEEPVLEGWERLETSTGIPYYSNKRLQKTQWDHPMMKQLELELKELDKVRFIAYRTALKLRAVQKNTRMSLIKLTLVKEVFIQRGLDRQADGVAQTVDVADVRDIVHSIYDRAQNDTWGQVPRKHCAELTINWLLNVYDCGRTGKMRVMSLKVGIATLSQARLIDKYVYLFEQICSVDSRVDKDSLKSLLKDWLLIARQLVKTECQAFGGNNPKAGVDCCFQYVGAPSSRNTIDLRQYLIWLRAEPQTIVFLPIMHRLAAAETMKHDAKCNECKDFPIVGMRFRSMKHVNVDLCQGCFFSCRGMNNKPENAKYYHEYCVPATSGEDVKDFAGALINKVTKGHRKNKPSFLVVNDLEGDKENSETQSMPAMRPVSAVHEEIRDLSENLQELEEHPAETRPDDDDEHELIRRYTEKLSQGMLATPTHRIPEDSGERAELERNIREMEDNKV
jgi:dystrophin